MDTVITIGEQTLTLRCTLRAAKTVNAMSTPAGFTTAFQRLAMMDFDAYATTIAAGTGKPLQEVEKLLFDNGWPQLCAPLSRFVEMLANGGKSPKDGEGDTTSGEG
jgi:hypothetical protein